MLNKSFGVIYFHFNIFSEKTANKWVLKFAFLRLKNLSQIYPFHTTCDSYEKCYTEANSVDTHFRDDFGQFKI